ncbi:MAG: hypothetical protein BAJALOKI2v1_380008 [Promethearchaeota archaeon]|nr:MAG: hypothetical protein BAJALOKI2v1_380008 [Candidatus Lokiarchaeota archaeon]
MIKPLLKFNYPKKIIFTSYLIKILIKKGKDVYDISRNYTITNPILTSNNSHHPCDRILYNFFH